MTGGETINSTVRRLERELGVREGFLHDLQQEDDWSFVIKAHAFVEAALTSLLATTIGKPDLAEVFSKLELSNKSTGKIAFAKALKVLEGNERRFLSALSELRNTLVHNISNIDFSFKSHFDGLNRDKQKQFIESFSYFAGGETFKHMGSVHKTTEFIRKEPRSAVYFSLMVFVAVVTIRKEPPDAKAIMEAVKRRLAAWEKNRAAPN